MSLARSLLETAQSLVGLDARRPKQANLRRSISTAYYALFHLLTSEAASLVVNERANQTLHAMLCRTLDHGDMHRVCRTFQAGYGSLPIAIRSLVSGVPQDLRVVAEAFVYLQQHRHEADYDMGRRYTRAQAIQILRRAEIAFAAWEQVRRSPEAQVFLLALMFGQRWNRL